MHCTDGQVSCFHGHGDLREAAPAMRRSAQRALGFTRTLLHQRFCCFCTNAPSKASVHTALLPGQAQEQCPLYCPGKLRSDARNRRTPPCLQRQNPGSQAARHAPSACRGQGCASGRAHIGEAAGKELDGVLALLPRIGHMEDHHRRQLEPADLRGTQRASVAPPAQPACSQLLRPALLTCIHNLVYALSVSTCWAAACCRSTRENAVPGRRAGSWTLALVVTSHEFPLHACFRPRLRFSTMRRARTSFPDWGRLGRTPKRAGREGSYTSGSVLRFTISCGRTPRCAVRSALLTPHSGRTPPMRTAARTPHMRTAASSAGI